jgi:magnesium-transporting ATPase (P-type)
MNYKSILKKHFETKQTGFLLCMVFLYALLITASILGFIDKYQGVFIAPVTLLLFVIICPLLSAYIEYKYTANKEPDEVTYQGFKNAADSLHEIKKTELAVGDVIFLSRGDVSPCGGRILEGEAEINQGVGDSTDLLEKGITNRAAKRTDSSTGNTVSSGDIIISGTVKIEVNDIEKKLFPKEKPTDVTDIFFAAALVLSVCLVAVRLVSGGFPNFLMFGQEVILDNVAVGAALCALIPILGQSDLFLRKIFINIQGENGVKSAEYPIENCAKLEEICADISFLEKTTSINFTSGELFTYEKTEDMPEKIAFSAALCIYRNSFNRFGIPINNADIKGAVEFFGMSEYNVPSRIVGAVHYNPKTRLSAVTIKSKGDQTTEVLGDIKLLLQCETYMDDDGKPVIITDEYRETIIAKLSMLSAKGVKTRLCAMTKDAIEGGSLPDTGLTLIGFLGYVTTVPDETATAVRELYENGVAIRLISHETPEYNNFLVGISPVTEIVKAPVFYGEHTLLAVNAPDFSDIASVYMSSENASMQAKNRADLYAESFDSIAKHMNGGKMFSFNRSICAVLSAVSYLMMWAILMFVLSILPVPFADGIIPIILVTALITGFIKTKIIGWKAY